MRDAGIAYAVDQIVDLIARGVDGIHLYTMNNPYVASKIHEAVYRLLARENPHRPDSVSMTKPSAAITFSSSLI